MIAANQPMPGRQLSRKQTIWLMIVIAVLAILAGAVPEYLEAKEERRNAEREKAFTEEWEAIRKMGNARGIDIQPPKYPAPERAMTEGVRGGRAAKARPARPARVVW